MLKPMLRKLIPQPIWERMRQLRVAHLAKTYRRRLVTHNYAGTRLNVVIADSISAGWYDHDWEPLHEVELLKTGGLQPGATVFDLGAHQGVVALILAQEVGNSGQVIAVEGMKHNCEVALENCRRNSAENVQVWHAVVADEPGELNFFQGLNGSVAKAGIGQRVEAVSVDQLAEEYGLPAVVFVDIEGYEVHALKGATQVLTKPCDWFIEVHVDAGLEEYGGSVQDVLSYFPASRYELFAWELDSGDKPRLYEVGDPVVNKRFGLVALDRTSAHRELNV